MAKWMVANRGGDFETIGKALDISPVLARVARNRGCIGVEQTRLYLEGELSDLPDPGQLPGAADAAALILSLLSEGRRIRIIGDYDCDGICASYILRRMLEAGTDPEKISVRLPERQTDGYGISERLSEEAVAEEVEAIVTCDNGSAAADALSRAKEAGMCVIVTDHHELPYTLSEDGEKHFVLPPADAVVEPKMTGEDGEPLLAFQDICGAQVAWKLAHLVLAGLAETGRISEEEKKACLEETMPFAALATVCDVMPLTGENRILVKHGLDAMAHSTNVGLAALLAVNGLTEVPLSAYHAGFVIGPCLNASGRLESATQALDLFFCTSEAEAMEQAKKLKSLNESRKYMTEKGVDEAVMKLAARRQTQDSVIVIHLPNVHESLAGIIAGRLRERYQRPALVLTDSASEPDILKGSGRSIEAYDLYAAMNEQKDLFVKFGGHKLAAGFSIRRENLQELRRRMNEACKLTGDDFAEVLHLDMVLPLSQVTM